MESKYSREALEPLVAGCSSLAEVLRALGIDDKAGGNYRFIRGKLRALGIDTSHFKGQGWARGQRTGPKRLIPDADLFVENCVYKLNGTRVKERLLRMGWPYECSICGIGNWMGRPLTLHLDHLNGVNNDNRLENLRFLCPNCHQQTETWGNKGSGSGRCRETEAIYLVRY